MALSGPCLGISLPDLRISLADAMRGLRLGFCLPDWNVSLADAMREIGPGICLPDLGMSLVARIPLKVLAVLSRNEWSVTVCAQLVVVVEIPISVQQKYM